MSGGFSNKPKILRGAFVEYGLSLPPLVVVFQFNPVQLTRSRTLSYSSVNEAAADTKDKDCKDTKGSSSMRKALAQREEEDLLEIQKKQQVTVQEESINFEIMLDASDKLNDGDVITQEFGIAPQLATLEAMVVPKGDSLLGAALGSLLGESEGHSLTRGENPPIILFIWGRQRVLPVNITSLNITETEFNTLLAPVQAKVSLSMTVIEGKNIPYVYSKIMKEAMSVLNLANITDIANVVIPG